MNHVEIKIIQSKIDNQQLRESLGQPFSEMIKFVVDIERGIIALGGEMHADAEQVLLDFGSKQENLWGGNVYPDAKPENQLEYTSLINIRPSQNNRSIEIQDPLLQNEMKNVINKLMEL